jgi:hypothetical protein
VGHRQGDQGHLPPAGLKKAACKPVDHGVTKNGEFGHCVPVEGEMRRYSSPKLPHCCLVATEFATLRGTKVTILVDRPDTKPSIALLLTQGKSA